MAQPNNIVLSLENIYPLSGNNVTDYYYEDGIVYIDGSENLQEAKQLALSTEQVYRTTRLKSRTELDTAPGTFVTHEGISINYNQFDEIYVTHNYVNSDDIDRDYNSSTIRNSWWYDTKKHRSYKVYTLLRYNDTFVIGGTTYYNWAAVNSWVAYRDATADPSDGVYKFTTLPPNDINVTASVKVKSPRGFDTWDTASLNIYKNNTLHTSSYIAAPSTVNGEIITEFLIPASSISLNDTWKMSVSVDGLIASIIDPLNVTEYSMSFDTTSPPLTPSFLGFVTPDDLNDYPECQPVLNNAVDLRKSLVLQDVDYSTGINIPQNINLIVSDGATKAATPDSNYSQYSHTLIRYYGSKTNRTAVNTGSVAIFNTDIPEGVSPYSFTSDNLGAIPNVSLLNYYTGYFNRIVDPYPLLNNKTAYFVQLLVDQNKDVLDPSLSEAGLNNILNTYRISDVNGIPTNAKASIISKTDADELKDLEEFRPVFKVAQYPTPIMYSQDSSNTFSTSIPVTDGIDTATGISPFWSYTGPDLKEIYLIPTNLNGVYSSGYSQKDLSYTPGPNKDFPLGTEPSYTKFPPITNKFVIKVGDEIRFENNENLSYRINNVTLSNIGGSNRVVLTVDRDIPSTTNLNFFIIRRYNNISNYVILDQQKPYSIPPSASSAPGILSTQYQVDSLDSNPDEIISSLIEKGIIE